jgi:hypothetical protein
MESIQNHLEHINLRFGVCTFPLPIVHLNKQAKDSRSLILVKAFPLCQEWFHANDIIVASCGHTYHPFCLFSYIKNSTCCAVEFCHEPMHLNWWVNMGLGPLLNEHEIVVVQLNLVE